jgi:hypothetical protein
MRSERLRSRRFTAGSDAMFSVMAEASPGRAPRRYPG